MKSKTLKIFLTFSAVLFLTGATSLAQPPGGRPAGPDAQTSVGPLGNQPINPEQEAADEMNRILRSLRVVEHFFGVPYEELEQAVTTPPEPYDQMLALLLEIHLRRVELHELMQDNNPPPGLVGQLIVEIHELERQRKEILEGWGNEIVELILDVEGGEQRLEHLYRVATLLPAFRQVGILPPPRPERPEQETE